MACTEHLECLVDFSVTQGHCKGTHFYPCVRDILEQPSVDSLLHHVPVMPQLTRVDTFQ